MRHAPALDSLVFGLSNSRHLSRQRVPVLYLASFKHSTVSAHISQSVHPAPQPPRHKGRHKYMCIPTGPSASVRTNIPSTTYKSNATQPRQNALRSEPLIRSAPRLGAIGQGRGEPAHRRQIPQTRTSPTPHTSQKMDSVTSIKLGRAFLHRTPFNVSCIRYDSSTRTSHESRLILQSRASSKPSAVSSS